VCYGKPSEQSSEQKSDDIRFEFDERSEFEQNREEQLERVKKRLDKTKRKMRGEQVPEESIDLGSIGESRNEIDWKLLLRREVEKSETIWSQRRSVAENNYAYRLEENEVEEEAETEVMIDVSGSVDLELVKAFLRELKPIIKQSKLKVGCFNEKFWGLVDVKTAKDIDGFTIPRAARSNQYAWTEDWDLAVRSFSKKREINKIVFTDGYPCPGTMPKEDLKRENVIWMVYGNKSFNPCCGRVINITEKQLGKLHQVYQEQER
jgi:predicted metal-dependent peptidase